MRQTLLSLMGSCGASFAAYLHAVGDGVFELKHGRGDLGRFFLGSVAEAVLRRANCGVLDVPPDDETARPSTTSSR